jgi:hypothetical protein
MVQNARLHVHQPPALEFYGDLKRRHLNTQISHTDPTLVQTPVEELERRWAATGIEGLDVFTPSYGKAAFCLPKWMQKVVDDAAGKS